MTVKELADRLNLSAVVLEEPEREASGVYVGDLLSWVMGRASAGNVWVTIMSNVNVVAVASLADVSTVILSEGVALDEGVEEAARARGVNVLASPLPSYEVCKLLFGTLG